MMASKEKLFQFVRDNNRSEITNLLTYEPELISTNYEDYDNKPILYIACENLAREVSPETVELLIKHKADLYYKHDKMEAIHFAVLGGNPNILHVVLENVENDRRNVIANGNTAINLLVRKKDATSKDTEMCLKYLLQFDVDVNIPNKQGHPPILWAAHKEYTNIIQTILSFGNPDLDKGKIGGQTARELIKEKGLYGGELPEPNTNNNEDISETLLSYIRDGNEEEFLKFPNLREYVDVETINGTLLQIACTLNSKNIVKRLIEEGAAVTKTSINNENEPISIAALHGFHEIFKILLDSHTEISGDILITLFKYIDGYNMGDTNHELCLEALLQSNKFVDVNFRSDTGNTPLHYAARYADGRVALMLLNKGASLADGDQLGFLPIEDLDASTLEEHFNNCITVIPESKYNKQNTIVTFNYSSLISTKVLNYLNNLKEEKFNEDDYLETYVTAPPERRHFSAETDIIGKISDSPQLRHLLCHPLVTSFLCVKWRRMEWLFYINLFLYIAFCVSLISYIFFFYNSKQNPNGNTPLLTLLIIMYLLIILRELFQIFMNMSIYFRQFDNWLELSIIGTTSAIIFQNNPGETTAKLLSSLAILLAALDFMLQIGLHPRMSTYVVMFRTVTFNFFKFLLWYSLLIIAFALTFYKLFNDDSKSSSEMNWNCTQNTSTEDDEQNFFENPSLTFIKTIVMLTGEFDATSINFNSVTSQLTFLAFVFMITIVLFNLLNALAVSDTQIIKNNSKIIGYQERVKRIIYMENMFLSDPFPFLTNIMSFFCYTTKCSTRNNLHIWIAKRVFIFFDFLKNYELQVYLNQDSKVIENQKSIHLDASTVKGIKIIFKERKCHNDQLEEKQMIKEIYNYIQQMKNCTVPDKKNKFNEHI